MSTQVATQTPPNVGGQSRGTGRRGGNRGRGGANRGQNRAAGRGAKAGGAERTATTQTGTVKDKETTASEEAGPVAENKASDEVDADDDTEVCFICAEPVKYYSVSECNHRTCHVCALRLRALYKKTECTFCKDPQPSVVFTRSPDALFSSYTAESIPYKDAKLAISFETQEMMEETLILLRFNCPDPDCDYIGNGWGDLKLHTRANHGKLMCDLCIRFKKVFSHEHALYPLNMLPFHLPSMMQRGSKTVSKEQVEGGVHPICEFCRECFFSGDELYSHMRERHEECFICKRNEVRDQYFQNYESLERHFNTVHFPCRQSQCQAQKFVVFNTPLDLQAHMVEEHGADMSTRDKKDARRIQAEFQFEEVGGGRHHGRRGGGRDREREPPGTQQPPPAAAGPSRPTGPAGSGARRRDAFNSSLTGDNSPQGGSGPATPAAPNRTPQPSRPPSPPRDNVDPAVAERHAAFIARVQSFAPNATTAVPAVKAATRSYRASESSARDLISTIWNVLDQNLENTASIVNAFVDLLEEEEKKHDLLASWKGFVIEQRRQFPDLLPAAAGGGYAGITSGRVLNAKNATATKSSQQSSRQVWDRVAEAASASSSTIFRPPPPRPAIKRKPQAPPPPPDSFPSLANNSSSTPVGTTLFRQGQRNTPWAQSGGGFRPPEPKIQVVPAVSQSSSGSSAPRKPPPKLSNALFPELPATNVARAKPPVSGNVSLRNILGKNAPASPAWQGSGSGDTVPAPAEPNAEGEQTQGGGKGRKGKGKQKQTLFTLGSFPT
ncbi:hypothetical protein BDQ17DRAFT_1342259 [Cyathus striatus]|nr:hypothetical protein BDQ17DRAFT_1342259 [Cyathus striatus]